MGAIETTFMNTTWFMTGAIVGAIVTRYYRDYKEKKKKEAMPNAGTATTA